MQLNTNLDILREVGDFDRYLILFHLATGDFELTDAGQVFDEDKFLERFGDICQRAPLEILRSLKYSGLITLTAGHVFTITHPHVFSIDDLTLTYKAKKGKAPAAPAKTANLKSCESLKHFNSPEFVEAWRAYEEAMTKKKKPRTPHTTKLGATELLKLSGGDEKIATAIVNQSTYHGWPGFFALKQPDKKQNQNRKNISQYYD